MDEKNNQIVVSTGAVRYNIVDEFGDEIGTIKFNPADVDIMRRYQEVSDYFKNLEVNDHPTMDELFKVTDDIKAKFDYLLNTNTSDTVFAKCNPLTPLGNGDLYCMNVLESIENIIEQVMTERTKATKGKIDDAVKDIINE